MKTFSRRTVLLGLGFLVPASFAQAQAKRSYTFGLVAKSQGNPVFQAARVGANDAARDLGQKHGIAIRID